MTNKESITELKDLKDYCHRTFMKKTYEAYTQALNTAIKALEQESILDKIRAEIEQIADEEQKHDKKWAMGLRYAVKIIDKYRAEGEK